MYSAVLFVKNDPIEWHILLRINMNESYIYDCLPDNRVVRNDRTIRVKQANMIKERWHRAFLEEILRRNFPDADYLPTKVNGKFADYTFYIGDDKLGLEIKNINPEGKSLGLGFTKKEIIAKFIDEKFRGLLLSCRGFTDNAKDLLEREDVHYAILPYQTTPSMSLKQWVKNKRVAVAFLSKYLNYHDPFKKVKKAKSCPKSTNLSISISLVTVYFEPYYVEISVNLDYSGPSRICLTNAVHELKYRTSELAIIDFVNLCFELGNRRNRIVLSHSGTFRSYLKMEVL